MPRRIRDLIGRCLQKDQSRRLQSIGDARIALQEWLENPEAEEVAADAAGGPGMEALAPLGGGRHRRGGRGLRWGATLLAPRASGARAAFAGPGRRPPLELSVGAAVAVSPNGRYLAYVTGSAARTSLVHPAPRPLRGHPGDGGNNTETPYQPFFSPDDEWLGFVTPGELKKVSVSGGSTGQALCRGPEPRGELGTERDHRVRPIGRAAGLSVVAASGRLARAR